MTDNLWGKVSLNQVVYVELSHFLCASLRYRLASVS